MATQTDPSGVLWQHKRDRAVPLLYVIISTTVQRLSVNNVCTFLKKNKKTKMTDFLNSCSWCVLCECEGFHERFQPALFSMGHITHYRDNLSSLEM